MSDPHPRVHRRPTLQEREATDRYYFSGTPLVLGELSRELCRGEWVHYLEPAIPVNGDIRLGRFVPDDDRPAVCVTSLAEMAVFRALSHQSLHTNLPQQVRRTGWRYDGDMPTYLATAELLENVQRFRAVGMTLLSTVVAIPRIVAPFEPFARERHQFRSYQRVPLSTAAIVDVTVDDWPARVEECPPWPDNFDLSSYKPHQPDAHAYLLELCAERAVQV